MSDTTHTTRNFDWWRPEGQAVGRGLVLDPEAGAGPGSAIPFWAVMAFTLVLLTAPQSHFPALAPLRPALLAAGVAVVAHLLDRITRREAILPLTAGLTIAGCLLGWTVVTIPMSYWPAGSLTFLLEYYLKSLAVFWLLASVVSTADRLAKIAWGLVLTSVPLAVTALNNLISGVFHPLGVAPRFGRILGYDAPLTGNANDLALTLNLILPFGIGLLLMTNRPRARLLLFVILALDVLAVVATFSRGGFLTLSAIVLIYIGKLFRSSERRWALPALLAMLVVAAAFVPAGYLDQMATIADIDSDPTGSAQERWGDLIAASRLVLENPVVGVGVGMNVLAMNEERGARWRVVHNVYLEYALELGIPGLALFVMLLVLCIRRAGAIRRMAADDPRLRPLFRLAEAVQVSLIAFSIAALFHPVGYHFYFYYFGGLALALEAVGRFELRRRAALGGGHAG